MRTGTSHTPEDALGLEQGSSEAESYTYSPGIPPVPSSVFVVLPVLERLRRCVADDAISILFGECERDTHPADIHVVLRRVPEQDGLFDEAKTYGPWREAVEPILRFRGPKW
jgi:hypothetical protein